jgi:hypothetical protein
MIVGISARNPVGAISLKMNISCLSGSGTYSRYMVVALDQDIQGVLVADDPEQTCDRAAPKTDSTTIFPSNSVIISHGLYKSHPIGGDRFPVGVQKHV